LLATISPILRETWKRARKLNFAIAKQPPKSKRKPLEVQKAELTKRRFLK
jgi:hypothetical protein